MCSVGSIRPPSTKITKTIASTGRWQSNPMSSSREKKREKNIGRRRRVMAPTFCRPCWMSLTWLSDDYGNSIPTIDPVSCMFGSFSSPLTICVRLSHSPKLKKKKEEENNKRAARELSVDTGFLPIRSLPCYVALPLTRKRTWLLERRVSVCSHPSSNSQAAQ